jgi:hypothetical protein
MKSACSSNVFKHGAMYGSQIGAEKAKLKLRELKELTESHHAKVLCLWKAEAARDKAA